MARKKLKSKTSKNIVKAFDTLQDDWGKFSKLSPSQMRKKIEGLRSRQEPNWEAMGEIASIEKEAAKQDQKRTKAKSGGKVNMPKKKRTNKQLGGIARKTLGIAQDKALEERGWDNGNAPTAEESDESRRRRLLAKRRKRATAAKNTEVALEEKGKKLPKSAFKSKKAKEEVWETIGKAVAGWAGKSGGGKVYATQNKKYGGGVYPKVGNTGD